MTVSEYTCSTCIHEDDYKNCPLYLAKKRTDSEACDHYCEKDVREVARQLDPLASTRGKGDE